MEIVVFAVVAAGFILFGLLRWRQAVWGALFLVLFEGAIRKWLLPQFQAEIFFLKDFLLLGAYLAYFFRERMGRGLKPFRPHRANALFWMIAALCIVQVANPHLPSILVGLLGLQNYLFYIPLMYMVPDLIPDRATLQRFAGWALALSFVPLVLGPMQFSLPPDHPLNRYAHNVDALNTIATFGQDHARVTSTFSYITGYDVYLDALFVLVFAFVLLGPPGRFRKTLYAVLGLTIANLLMTGSRAPLLYAGLCAPLMILAAASSMKTRDVRKAMLAVCLVPVLLMGVVKVFPEALAAFVNRTETANDTDKRFEGLIQNPVVAAEQAGVMGWGTGSTYQGASFVLTPGKSYDLPPGAEGEWERIILEIGVVGLALIVASRVLICLQLWAAYRGAQPALRPLLLAGLFFTGISISSNLVMEHTASILYFFCAGFAFVALPIERGQAVPIASGLQRRFVATPPASILRGAR